VVMVRNPRPARAARRCPQFSKLTSFLEDVKVGIHGRRAPLHRLSRGRDTVDRRRECSCKYYSGAGKKTNSPSRRVSIPDGRIAVAVTQSLPLWLAGCCGRTVCADSNRIKRSRKSEIPNSGCAPEGTSLTNGRISISVEPTGRVTFYRQSSAKRTIDDLPAMGKCRRT